MGIGSREDATMRKKVAKAFAAIADNYPRYVLTLDDVFVPDRNGVQVINAIDFLAGRADLTR